MIHTVKTMLWDPLMDAERNPLMAVPALPRYQIMTVLAMMWSFIFCACVGWMLLFPYWIVGHIALLGLGAFVTNYTFKINRTLTHRDLYRSPEKTHALHDDIWGG
jgi:hypothetical protein